MLFETVTMTMATADNPQPQTSKNHELAFIYSIISPNKPTSKMTTNIGVQAADAVNEKLVERQKLEQEMYAHHQDLQTLISQRNENEMVKEVRKSWRNCIVRLCVFWFFHVSFISC